MTRLLAQVHTNSDDSLKVIANLIKKKFGLPFHNNHNGTCLYNQFVFTISSLFGKSPTKIHNEELMQSSGPDGLSPQQLIDTYRTNGYSVGYQGYDDIDAAIADVQLGQPVVLVINSRNPAWTASTYLDIDGWRPPRDREPGEITKFSGNILVKPDVGYHALLIVGYDIAGDFVIFRESRDCYGYKGYLKIKKSLLKSRPKSAVYFAFTMEK